MRRRWWIEQGGDWRVRGGAEMGANLPAIELGTGRSAVAVSAGFYHTCVLLVRCGGEGLGSQFMVMQGWNGRGGNSVIPTQLSRSTMRHTAPAPRVRGSVDRQAVFDAFNPYVLPRA